VGRVKATDAMTALIRSDDGFELVRDGKNLVVV